MTDIVVDALGTSVRVRSPSPLHADLRSALADLPRGASPTREVALVEDEGGLRLVDGPRVVRTSIDPTLAVATVVWHVNSIAAETSRHVLVHAGCVAGPTGGAVLLPGRSGAGKSTLTAACLATGLAYLSDELAALDRTSGSITPYPKPLALDGERLVTASSLGATIAAPQPPVGIVFPRFEPDAPVHAVALDARWTLLALAAHCPNLATLGAEGLRWLAGLALACPGIQVTYGRADRAAEVVGRAARQPAVSLRAAEELEPVTSDTSSVAVGDDIAVLHHRTGQVNLLNPSAAAVWRIAAGADEPARALEDVLRSPVAGDLDAASARATLDRLVGAELLPGPGSR